MGGLPMRQLWFYMGQRLLLKLIPQRLLELVMGRKDWLLVTAHRVESRTRSLTWPILDERGLREPHFAMLSHLQDLNLSLILFLILTERLLVPAHQSGLHPSLQQRAANRRGLLQIFCAN